MSSLQDRVKYTYDDLLTFPDDGKRREIVEGKLYVTPSPATPHQTIVGNLYFLIRSYLAKGLSRNKLYKCEGAWYS